MAGYATADDYRRAIHFVTCIILQYTTTAFIGDRSYYQWLIQISLRVALYRPPTGGLARLRAPAA